MEAVHSPGCVPACQRRARGCRPAVETRPRRAVACAPTAAQPRAVRPRLRPHRVQTHAAHSANIATPLSGPPRRRTDGATQCIRAGASSWARRCSPCAADRTPATATRLCRHLLHHRAVGRHVAW